MNIYNTEPYYINEIKTKWWPHDRLTRYALNEDNHGITLDVMCYFVEASMGMRGIVLVKNGVVREDARTETDMINIIDAMKLEKRPNYCYIVIVDDESSEPITLPYTDKAMAIVAAKKIAQLNCVDSEYEEEQIDGWLFYARYNYAGDNVKVIKSAFNKIIE